MRRSLGPGSSEVIAEQSVLLGEGLAVHQRVAAAAAAEQTAHRFHEPRGVLCSTTAEVSRGEPAQLGLDVGDARIGTLTISTEGGAQQGLQAHEGTCHQLQHVATHGQRANVLLQREGALHHAHVAAVARTQLPQQGVVVLHRKLSTHGGRGQTHKESRSHCTTGSHHCVYGLWIGRSNQETMKLGAHDGTASHLGIDLLENETAAHISNTNTSAVDDEQVAMHGTSPLEHGGLRKRAARRSGGKQRRSVHQRIVEHTAVLELHKDRTLGGTVAFAQQGGELSR
mmetsp:Transcript_11777/g.35914  ORF Transcript_11777/g.35914 Transcript_11777/m.35914 type:complete len:284 (-) Transcript_11777:729-1580(-)